MCRIPMRISHRALNMLLDCHAACAASDPSVPLLTYTRDTLGRYTVVAPLAHGCYGDVFIVKNGSKLYALKRISKARAKRQPQTALFMAERDCLAANKGSVRAVHLISAFQDASSLFFVMPFLGGGDLLSLLARLDTLPLSSVGFYLAELLQALKDLHARGFVHRDVKPENILLSRSGHILLADFGSCARIGSVGCHPVGTPDYIAPEVLQAQGDYTTHPDVWSAGVVLYEMVHGSPPFCSSRLQDTYKLISKIEFDNTQGPEEVRELVSHMVCPKDERWGVDKLLQRVSELFELDLDKLDPPYHPHKEWAANFCDMPTEKEFDEQDVGYEGFIGFSYDENVRVDEIEDEVISQHLQNENIALEVAYDASGVINNTTSDSEDEIRQKSPYKNSRDEEKAVDMLKPDVTPSDQCQNLTEDSVVRIEASVKCSTKDSPLSTPFNLVRTEIRQKQIEILSVHSPQLGHTQFIPHPTETQVVSGLNNTFAQKNTNNDPSTYFPNLRVSKYDMVSKNTESASVSVQHILESDQPSKNQNTNENVSFEQNNGNPNIGEMHEGYNDLDNQILKNPADTPIYGNSDSSTNDVSIGETSKYNSTAQCTQSFGDNFLDHTQSSAQNEKNISEHKPNIVDAKKFFHNASSNQKGTIDSGSEGFMSELCNLKISDTSNKIKDRIRIFESQKSHQNIDPDNTLNAVNLPKHDPIKFQGSTVFEAGSNSNTNHPNDIRSIDDNSLLLGDISGDICLSLPNATKNDVRNSKIVIPKAECKHENVLAEFLDGAIRLQCTICLFHISAKRETVETVLTRKQDSAGHIPPDQTPGTMKQYASMDIVVDTAPSADHPSQVDVIEPVNKFITQSTTVSENVVINAVEPQSYIALATNPIQQIPATDCANTGGITSNFSEIQPFAENPAQRMSDTETVNANDIIITQTVFQPYATNTMQSTPVIENTDTGGVVYNPSDGVLCSTNPLIQSHNARNESVHMNIHTPIFTDPLIQSHNARNESVHMNIHTPIFTNPLIQSHNARNESVHMNIHTPIFTDPLIQSHNARNESVHMNIHTPIFTNPLIQSHNARNESVHMNIHTPIFTDPLIQSHNARNESVHMDIHTPIFTDPLIQSHNARNESVHMNIHTPIFTNPIYRPHIKEVFARINMYIETITNQRELIQCLTDQIVRENKLLKREIRKRDSQVDISGMKFLEEIKKELKMAKSGVKEVQQKLDSEIFLKERLQDEIKYLTQKLKVAMKARKVRELSLEVSILTFRDKQRKFTLQETKLEITSKSCFFNGDTISLANIYIYRLRENELFFIPEKHRRLILKIIIVSKHTRRLTNVSSIKSEEELSQEIEKENKILSGLQNLLKAVPPRSEIHIKALKQKEGTIKRINQLKKDLECRKSYASEKVTQESFGSQKTLKIPESGTIDAPKDNQSPLETDMHSVENTAESKYLSDIIPALCVKEQETNVFAQNKTLISSLGDEVAQKGTTTFLDFLKNNPNDPKNRSHLPVNRFKIPQKSSSIKRPYIETNDEITPVKDQRINVKPPLKLETGTSTRTLEFNNHIFRIQTFSGEKICYHCDQILYGSVNQGMQCQECSMIVHQSCYVLIEDSCEMYKATKEGNVVYILCRSMEEKARILSVLEI